MAKNSPSKIAANRRYAKKAYDRIYFFARKGQRDVVKAHAASMGESVNAFVLRAVYSTMEQDKRGRDTPAAASAEIEKSAE